MARFLDAGWHDGSHGSDVLEDVETLMCLMRKYYGTCEVTLEQRHDAFKKEYGPKLLDGTWDREMFVIGFPRDRAQMTLEQVEAFADGIIASQ